MTVIVRGNIGYEVRADGWPLCPNCDEDELYSRLQWNGMGERPSVDEFIEAGLKCYQCGWDNQMPTIYYHPPLNPQRPGGNA